MSNDDGLVAMTGKLTLQEAYDWLRNLSDSQFADVADSEQTEDILSGLVGATGRGLDRIEHLQSTNDELERKLAQRDDLLKARIQRCRDAAARQGEWLRAKDALLDLQDDFAALTPVGRND